MAPPFDLDLPQPRQPRSVQTQQSLVDAGRAILREMPWEAVSIQMIAKRAGRSVGVFYQRFGSKEDFLTLLLKQWLDEGYAQLDKQLAGDTPLTMIDLYLVDVFDRIRTNRYLWRAGLQRAMDDPATWEPFRHFAAARRVQFAEQFGERRGKALNDTERHRLDLATQVFNSVINNALLNDPGPLRVDQAEFFPTLKDIFLTIAALDL
jgi:AcrR family transcriptional regulator